MTKDEMIAMLMKHIREGWGQKKCVEFISETVSKMDLDDVEEMLYNQGLISTEEE